MVHNTNIFKYPLYKPTQYNTNIFGGIFMAEKTLYQKIIIESDPAETHELASQGIDAKRSQLFEKFGQQNISETIWSVVIEPKADGPVEPLTGEGPSYDAAYSRAATSLKNDQPIAKTAIKVTEHYDLQCGKITSQATGKSKQALLENLARDVEILQGRCGEHLVKDPLNVSYTVTLYSGGWKGKEDKPKGVEVSTATSNKSLEEAEQLAIAQAGDAKYKGKIFTGTQEFKLITAGMSKQEISDLLGHVPENTAIQTSPKSPSKSSKIESRGTSAGYAPVSTALYDCV